jgi:hypothetical protein
VKDRGLRVVKNEKGIKKDKKMAMGSMIQCFAFITSAKLCEGLFGPVAGCREMLISLSRVVFMYLRRLAKVLPLKKCKWNIEIKRIINNGIAFQFLCSPEKTFNVTWSVAPTLGKSCSRSLQLFLFKLTHRNPSIIHFLTKFGASLASVLWLTIIFYDWRTLTILGRPFLYDNLKKIFGGVL